MCTHYGKSWSKLPQKGKRITYLELLLDYKITWLAMEEGPDNGNTFPVP